MKKYDLHLVSLQKYESLDPLEADNSVNLIVARMLYLTPLEVRSDNKLTSQILEEFSYDVQNREIFFKIRNGLLFSDTSPITTEDVAIAILRFAYTHPTFPVIKKIVGLSDWVKTKQPLRSLPSGFSIDGQVIRIRLAKTEANPLYRFCLEVFSIIPKKCIDLDSGKLLCKDIPTSGNYILSSESSNRLEFKLRFSPYKTHQIEVPTEIGFNYVDTNDWTAIAKTDSIHGVFKGTSSGLAFLDVDLAKMDFVATSAPESYFTALIFNPHYKGFTNSSCRKAFADKYRALLKAAVPSLSTSRSFFAPIVPGHMADDQLAAPIDSTHCFSEFRNSGLDWVTSPKGRKILYEKLFIDTARELGIKLNSPKFIDSYSDAGQRFEKGEIPFVLFASGFWSLDPVGDLQMMFTPGLHKMLLFAAQKKEYRSILDKIDRAEEGEISDLMKSFNQLIQDDAIINPLYHYNTFYASKDKSLLQYLPLTVQEPYPWQIFKVD